MAMITNWMSQTLPSLVGLNTTKLTAASGGTLDRSTGVSAGGWGETGGVGVCPEHLCLQGRLRPGSRPAPPRQPGPSPPGCPPGRQNLSLAKSCPGTPPRRAVSVCPCHPPRQIQRETTAAKSSAPGGGSAAAPRVMGASHRGVLCQCPPPCRAGTVRSVWGRGGWQEMGEWGGGAGGAPSSALGLIHPQPWANWGGFALPPARGLQSFPRRCSAVAWRSGSGQQVRVPQGLVCFPAFNQ